MVTFINAGGAVHTVNRETFDSLYRGKVRKLTGALEKKLEKLDADITTASAKRLSAVDEDGNPDTSARNKGALEYQAAIKARAEFVTSLIEDL